MGFMEIHNQVENRQKLNKILIFSQVLSACYLSYTNWYFNYCYCRKKVLWVEYQTQIMFCYVNFGKVIYAHKFALEKFAGDLLPVVDNLERALRTISAEDEAQKAVSTGLELTLKSFIEVLEKFKIEAIDPSGQPFDAELHQAVSMVPNPDLEPNTVMDVFQKGYTLNGRLVRPAMVVVSQGS